MNYLKTALYAVLAALLIWLGWSVNGWRKDAAKLPQVQGQFDSYRKAAEQTAEAWRKAKEADEKAKSALQTAQADLQKRVDELRQRPIKEVVTREITLPNGTVCPVARLSSEFFSLYNDAADAAVPTKGIAF